MSNGTTKTQGERMVIPGLVAIHCESKVYVGKIDVRDDKAGRVTLRDAIEFLFQRKVLADGKVESTIIPAPVFPTNGPTTIELWASVIVPIEDIQDLVAMYATMTNRPVLFIPDMR